MALSRYSNYGAMDDVPVNDGDGAFSGFKSRLQPTYLQPGELWYSGNMRLDKGTAKVRKGLKSLSTDIVLVNPPLIVSQFSLAASVSVTSINRAGNTATVVTSTTHGYSSTDRINIRGAVQTDYNGDYTVAVVSGTSFTYTVANTPVTPATGTILANKGPRVYNAYSTQVVGSGDYADNNSNTEGIIVATTATAYLYRYGQSTIALTYPANEVCTLGQPCTIVQYLNQVYLFRGYSTTTAAPAAFTSITQAAGTATATTTANHGLSSLSWVLISGASPNGYTGIVQITVTGVNTFTYTVSGALASPATGTIIYRPVQPPLVWDMNVSTHAFVVVPTGPNATGAPIINMPAVDWGIYFTSRMVLPWSRDQLIMSDILSATNYDPSQTQFRLLPGTNDWIVAAFPYQQARLLVLYRKSVHTIFLDGTLSISNSYEVTRNFGCVARRTVANCGPYILWLSDIGVVKMEIDNELSLTNNETPLSDDINDIISTINWQYAGNAVATFWNNRYYIAVPTGTSNVNNTVLVYNFLNSKWESVDTYPGGYDVLNFHVISYNGSKRIHSVGSYAYVSLLEENDIDQFGPGSSTQTFPIVGTLKTRNYLAGTHDIKKVRRFQLEASLAPPDTFTSQYVLSNPDYTQVSQVYSAGETSDVTIRSLVKRRGTSGRLEITTSLGRPEFTAVITESSITSRASTNYT
jgi:hypothetical protein